MNVGIIFIEDKHGATYFIGISEIGMVYFNPDCTELQVDWKSGEATIIELTKESGEDLRNQFVTYVNPPKLRKGEL